MINYLETFWVVGMMFTFGFVKVEYCNCWWKKIITFICLILAIMLVWPIYLGEEIRDILERNK